MPYPTATEYQDTIADSLNCFLDDDLKLGEALLRPDDLPLVETGNFAAVFFIRTKKKTYAVRCFLGQQSDRRERYDMVSRELRQSPIEYMVDFEYLPQGILVAGTTYPILKMDFVEGEFLDEFIESNLQEPGALRFMADKWAAMSRALRARGIAHGDLQHGNVFIASESIKLIDYDNMFVPNLSGKRSDESGMEGYQHPERNSSHFGPYLDNFSDWIIYSALRILGEDNKYWQWVDTEDKHLLFRPVDFANPSNSERFTELKAHKSPIVRQLANNIENLLTYNVEELPALEPGIQIPSSAERKQTPADTKTSWAAPGSIQDTGLKQDIQSRSVSNPRPQANSQTTSEQSSSRQSANREIKDSTGGGQRSSAAQPASSSAKSISDNNQPLQFKSSLRARLIFAALVTLPVIAISTIGSAYFWLAQSEPNQFKSNELLAKAAFISKQAFSSFGDEKLLLHIAHMHDKGIGTPKDKQKALELLRAAAEDGSPEAKSQLAAKYLASGAGEENHKKALALYEELADQDRAEGFSGLARIYYEGIGVKRDYKKALEYLSSVEEKGDEYGKYLLGLMTFYGRGIKADKEKGYDLLSGAAERQCPEAQYEMGIINATGSMDEKDPDEAIRWFKKAYENGHMISAFKIGKMYEKGEGVEEDIEEALSWYEKMAEGGEPLGLIAQGRIYQTAKFGKKDLEQARELYEKAAAQNDSLAMSLLGLMYLNGESVDKNPAKALEWFRKSAEKGNQLGQYNLALMYEEGTGVEKNSQRALELYKKSAVQGNIEAQRKTGYFYHNGIGTTKNNLHALLYYLMASDGGDPESPYRLSQIYMNKSSLLNDEKKGIQYLKLSASRGYPAAQRALGSFYLAGLMGLPKNTSEGLKWMDKAADNGDAIAAETIGLIYLTGALNMKSNYTRAYELLSLAAKNGRATAQHYLGTMYEFGLGIKTDKEKATAWYKKATENGYVPPKQATATSSQKPPARRQSTSRFYDPARSTRAYSTTRSITRIPNENTVRPAPPRSLTPQNYQPPTYMPPTKSPPSFHIRRPQPERAKR